MPAAADALLTKSDDELRFFVNNPQLYQPELVAAAQRELRRRGALAAPARPAPAPAGQADGAGSPAAPPAAGEPTYETVPASRSGLTVGLVVGALVLLGAGWYWWPVGGRASASAARPAPAPPAANLSPDSLKLESVPTYAIPSFDVPQLVHDQLASLPGRPPEPAQELRQFRELCRRFWEAETQSEYLSNAAYMHQTAPNFTQQTEQVRETWRAWNHAAVYTFHFKPATHKQFLLMGQVASSQQHILSQLPKLLKRDKFRTDKEMRARQADVQHWMASLRPTSPVTGKPYRAEVMRLNYHP